MHVRDTMQSISLRESPMACAALCGGDLDMDFQRKRLYPFRQIACETSSNSLRLGQCFDRRRKLAVLCSTFPVDFATERPFR